MTPFNFLYHRPETLAEAVEAYAHAEKEGLKPAYLAGATEIMTFCRFYPFCGFCACSRPKLPGPKNHHYLARMSYFGAGRGVCSLIKSQTRVQGTPWAAPLAVPPTLWFKSRTTKGGAILTRAGAGPAWQPAGKVMLRWYGYSLPPEEMQRLAAAQR